MNLDPETRRALMQVFDEELNEQLMQMEQLISKVESDSGFDAENYHTLFRIAHTIKGSSRSIDLQSVSLVAEQMESLFQELKSKCQVITPNQVIVCRSAIDIMRVAEKTFKATGDDSEDVQSVVDTLVHCQAGES